MRKLLLFLFAVTMIQIGLSADDYSDLRAHAVALIADFDARVATADALGNALDDIYSERVEDLEDVLDCGNIDTLQRECDYVEYHITPWVDGTFVFDEDGILLTIQARNYASDRIAVFPVNFALLEAASNKTFSRFRADVFVSMGTTALNSRLIPLTPNRSTLSWNIVSSTQAYTLRFYEADDDETIPLNKLIGDGDHLMTDYTAYSTMSYFIWSLVFTDFFGDVNPAIVTGDFTDYAYIWRDLGATAGTHLFNEAARYRVCDKYDNPIATTDYHGRATSMAFPCDLDNDGKEDIILNRYDFYEASVNTDAVLPLFVRNLSSDPKEMKYAEPARLTTLSTGGWHYTYGDVNGDGKADAIGALDQGSTMQLSYFAGLGPNILGVPQFASPASLNISISKSSSTISPSQIVFAALRDLNGDGKPDLTVQTPLRVYISYNYSSTYYIAFGTPILVTDSDGSTPFALNTYYPSIDWHDVNGDGYLDLLRSPGFCHHRATNGDITDLGSSIAMSWLYKQYKLGDVIQTMFGFDIVDIDDDGKLEYCEIDSSMRLKEYEYNNRMFGYTPTLTQLGTAGDEFYGCPDPDQYDVLYSQVEIADMDGDGLPDLLVNNEHNWRFGYYSFYRNLGNGSFAAEEHLVPNPDNSHIRLNGGLLHVDEDSNLDYLSFETKDRVYPEGGTLRFSYVPFAASSSDPRTIFSCGFWDKTQISASELYDLYYDAEDVEDILDEIDYFALMVMPDGKLRCQLGAGSSVTSASSLNLSAGVAVTFKIIYDSNGTDIYFNDNLLMQTAATPAHIADRIHIGSLAWCGVQRDREYPWRYTDYPTDFSMPADGRIGYILFYDENYTPTVDIRFYNQSYGPLIPRCRVAYRTTPAVTTYNSQPALIAHFGDHRREEDGTDKAVLNIVPFTRTQGQAPTFGTAIPLEKTDQTPLYARNRTQVVPFDWNGDDDEDLILAAPGYEGLYQTGIEVYINDGSYNFSQLTGNSALTLLNELATPHNAPKVVFASLSGATDPDIVTWSNNGLQVFRQTFLFDDMVKFDVEDEVSEYVQVQDGAAYLIDLFDDRLSTVDALSEALDEVYSERVAEFDDLIDCDDISILQKECGYFARHIEPWIETSISVTGTKVIVYLSANNYVSGGIAAFPINFDLLEAASEMSLSRYQVDVFASGGATALNSRLDPINPNRSIIKWAVTGATSYRLEFYPSSTTIPLVKLVGDCDHLMTSYTANYTMSYNTWSLVFNNIFGDTNPAMVTGDFTDYAFIWRDLGATTSTHLFSQAACYKVRDRYDEPIGTYNAYPGRATSMAFPCDLDSDGKTDIILHRYEFYGIGLTDEDKLPLFVKNLSSDPEEMKYADPVLLDTLEPGWHYTYGDVDGDNVVDAIGALDLGSTMQLSFFEGLGPDANGVPQFDDLANLNISIPKASSTIYTSRAVLPVLKDLNSDGKLDLTVQTPPNVYIAYNTTSGGNVTFGTPIQLTEPDGSTPFALDTYYPAISWHDVDRDGYLDLVRTPSSKYHLSDDGDITELGSSTSLVWLNKQYRLRDVTSALTGFDIVDIDNDGKLEYCEVDKDMKLRMYEYNNGLFSVSATVIDLEPNRSDFYGCPDPDEYGHLYCELEIADMDGDGLLDLIVNSEHNWRFGYYSYYRNLGGGSFAAEEKLVPVPDNSHIRLNGSLLHVDEDSNLDYLSFETKDCLYSEGGTIRMSYVPFAASSSDPRTIFSCGFWDKTQISASELYDLYYEAEDIEDVLDEIDYFALIVMPDGKLRCQLGAGVSFTSASSLNLQAGVAAYFKVVYDEYGTDVYFNDNLLMQSVEVPERIAERIHIGSLAWCGVQRDREYPERWSRHPIDFSFPADGRFGYLLFYDENYTPTVDIRFYNQSYGPLVPRQKISYRTTPAVYNSGAQWNMVTHAGDFRREQVGTEDKAVLNTIPFTRTQGQAPTFGTPSAMTMDDDSPFYSFSRTQVVPVDWDGDSHLDMVLSTAGFAGLYHKDVEVFINDGSGGYTRVTDDPALVRLNELITPHHDTKFVFASLSGATDPDIVTWTDTGVRVSRQTFLKEDTVEFDVDTLTFP